MSSLSLAPIYQYRRLKKTPLADGVVCWRSNVNHYKVFLAGSFPGEMLRIRVGLNSGRRVLRFPCVRCEKKEEPIEQVSVEFPPYDSYMDSTSGQLEPASGARASIPGEEYWPEGTSSQVRAANAPQPRGKSEGAPSYGKNPGSRRKKYKTSNPSNESDEMTEDITVSSEAGEDSTVGAYSIEEEDDGLDKSKELFSDYVVYQTEPEEQEFTEFELDKEMGRPHPFIDPKVRKPVEQPLSSEEAWWYWGKPDKEEEERCEWQRRKPDAETVFLKAMAETGQVKLYGDFPTLTETSLYRARRHLYKEERLQDEMKRLETVGPLAYYSEWVQAWKRDTSREAVQKHFEETGEDENTQLIQMFQHQTDREYRIMMGTDVRVRRDPLAMRMREDQIKQIWGGDPVFPTVNSIQDPNEVIDFRSPDYHEPTPNFVSILKERGLIITNEELQKILSKEKTEVVEVTDMDEAMARAVDIGENDDGEDSEDSEVDGDDDKEVKVSRNWSVLKSAPELYKSKDKPEKQGPLSLEEAIDDSENLTDFLLDFNEEE